MNKKVILILSLVIGTLIIGSILFMQQYARSISSKEQKEETNLLHNNSPTRNNTTLPKDNYAQDNKSTQNNIVTQEENSTQNNIVTQEENSTQDNIITQEDNSTQDNIVTQEENSTQNINSNETSPIILAFAGDVNLDDNSKPIARYDREKKGILGGLSKDLLDEMKAANIMMLNNEFSFSTRGLKAKNKSYTFRAHPERVNILKEMGVDIVSLANNHTLDYGEEAFLDTLKTLETAGIDYVGAGINLDKAKAPVTYTIGDKTISFLAASRVIFSTDWYATAKRPGMVGTYDPSLLIQAIQETKAKSDFVVAFLHWGVERNNHPEDYQRDFAKRYIDAGADAVIGCHPHVLQGLEIYKGKPIAYSLGNFWFNNTPRESGLLKLILTTDGSVKVQMVPVYTAKSYTYLITEEKEKADYYDFMENISFGISFDENGFIHEKTE